MANKTLTLTGAAGDTVESDEFTGPGGPFNILVDGTPSFGPVQLLRKNLSSNAFDIIDQFFVGTPAVNVNEITAGTYKLSVTGLGQAISVHVELDGIAA